MKIRRRIALLTVALMSSVMLTACGSQNKSHSSDESKTSSSKVVKSKKKTQKKAKKASSSSSSSVTSSSSSSSSTSSQQQSNIQLGLGDVAVWTDANGVTHHVDSDGMDRQQVPGSNQIRYADWSGPLPANATVQHSSGQ